MGVKPGAELMAAIKSAEAIGAKLVLADRDIQATLKRTWHSLGFWNRSKLIGSLIGTPFAMEEIGEEQIEALKDRDTISEMLDELAVMMPDLKEPLIDERDRYLISSIVEAPGQKIVAVVGAGHVRGIAREPRKTGGSRGHQCDPQAFTLGNAHRPGSFPSLFSEPSISVGATIRAKA